MKNGGFKVEINSVKDLLKVLNFLRISLEYWKNIVDLQNQMLKKDSYELFKSLEKAREETVTACLKFDQRINGSRIHWKKWFRKLEEIDSARFQELKGKIRTAQECITETDKENMLIIERKQFNLLNIHSFLFERDNLSSLENREN